MRNILTALPVLLLLVLSLTACGGGGGGGGGGGKGGGTQAAYDVQVSGPFGGAQVNRPFSVNLNFLAAGTTNSINVKTSETITASIVSGPGAMAGAVSTSGNNTSALTFNGLVLDTIGTYVLQFTGPHAATPGVTASFNVGPQLDLQFASIPGSTAIYSKFSVTVQTVAAGTSTPTAPSGPISITISLASGTGTLYGTTTKTLSSGSSLAFDDLLYDTVESITLRASSNGFPDVTSGAISVGNVTFTSNIGPFVALKTVRVGDAYSDTVAFAASNTALGFAVKSGSSLPAGLSINHLTGEVSGTPTTAGSYEFLLYATLPGAQAQQIRCALAVFSSAESEIVSGQSFVAAGPYTPVGPVNDTITFTSSYDGVSYAQAGTFNCRIQYYYPNFATAPSPAPVMVHHRGRGFNMVDYDMLGAHVASYGIIFITVEDYQSFVDGGGASAAAGGASTPTNSSYDNFSTGYRGQASGSAFQEGAMEWVIAKNSQSGHALENKVDTDNIFMSGHSRGGGSTQSSHVRSQPYMFNGTQRQNIDIKGVLIFMAVDMRYWSAPVAGDSTIYPIATMMPRLPSLVIAAENDGDVNYPLADEFIDRATGPSTFATIYGGCHAFLSDTGVAFSGGAYITRQQQMDRIFNLVVAFIKRWSAMDLSLEGLLYGNELAGSTEVGVCAWRNMAERVMVDDFQGGNQNVNTLGGSNTQSAGTRNTSGAIYPNLGNMGSLNLRHNIMSLPAATTCTYTANIPSANQDLSNTRRFMFRIGAVDSGAALKGFDWTTVRVRLTDAQADFATITLFDTAAPNNNYLPDYPGSGSNVYDRFVDASVLLSAFTTANSNLDLDQLTDVQLIFETAAGSTRQVYLDDLRFE